MERLRFERRIQASLEQFPVVGLLGPRQCGKTTLARSVAGQHPGFEPRTNYFDLEDPLSLARLENPMSALGPLRGLVVLDEIQRRPNLFEILRVLADRRPIDARFLVLGSASRDLLRQSSESLAGRIGYLELTPFSLYETGVNGMHSLHLRGGFPPSFLAGSDAMSVEWRESFIRSFLERDVPALGFGMPPAALGRFWRMLAHYHGAIFNSSEIGAAMGVSHHTSRGYLDVLAGTFMVRQLNPWFENLRKRQVKSPKIYFRDSGILHRLLRIDSREDLLTHPKLGASWEGFALEETIRALDARDDDIFFWAVHGQAEIDLLVFQGTRRLGFEFKYVDAPVRTRSMLTAIETLRLDVLSVIYPGEVAYQIGDGIRAVPLAELVVPGGAQSAAN